MSLLFPKEYGGSGPDGFSFCFAVEKIAKVCVCSTSILRVESTLLKPGIDCQHLGAKGKYCRPLASWEKFCAFRLTEPGAGSDAGAMAVRSLCDMESGESQRRASHTYLRFRWVGGCAELYRRAMFGRGYSMAQLRSTAKRGKFLGFGQAQ